EDVPMGTLPAARPQAAVPAESSAPAPAAMRPPAPADAPIRSDVAVTPAADGEQLAMVMPATEKPAGPGISAEADEPILDTTEPAELLIDPVPNASDYAPPASPVAPRRPPDLKARMVAAVQA